MILLSQLASLTCIPEEPQVAEQGPQAVQAAESHWSRGQEGRRHLLNLSFLFVQEPEAKQETDQGSENSVFDDTHKMVGQRF